MPRTLPIALTLALLAGCECRGKGNEPDPKLTPAYPLPATVTPGPLPQRLLRPLADQSRPELLAMLGRELARIRATTVTGQDAVGLDTVPDVQVLVGASSDEIEKALTVPDHCPMHPNCSAAVGSEWDYDFYKLPPMTVGGGSYLVLEFGTDHACKSATWRFSR